MKPIRFDYSCSADNRGEIEKRILSDTAPERLREGVATREIQFAARVTLAGSDASFEIVPRPWKGFKSLVTDTVERIDELVKTRYSGQPGVDVTIEFIEFIPAK